MRLRLPYPPVPAHAADLAAVAAQAAKEVDGIDLDYSPKSLALVDGILMKFHEEGLKPGQVGETVFLFGCYAGEVFVRHAKGAWVEGKQTTLGRIAGRDSWMIVRLPGGGEVNPIGKAFKLVENGETDSIAYVWTVMSKVGPSGV